MSSKSSPGMKRDTARRMNGRRVPCSRNQVVGGLQDQGAGEAHDSRLSVIGRSV